MAERRMFAKTIVTSDAFLDLPMSSRCLYFTLGVLADDDGFVNSPKSVMRQVGASNDDLKMLMAKKFVIGFDSGVIVIKHWRINNYLRGDRYAETKYKDEKGLLTVDEDGIYHAETDNGLAVGIPTVDQRYTNGIPMVDQRYTQDSIGKDSKGKLKNIYGEFKHVSLTEDEYTKLCTEYGEQKTQQAITYLDEYVEDKKYKHKNSYLTIRRWVMNALDENAKKTAPRKPDRTGVSRGTDYNTMVVNEFFKESEGI